MPTLTLRSYQIEGARFLRTRRRAMLMDSYGLGKTVQALQAAEPPIIVVCPAYLARQWHDFLCEEFEGTPHTVALVQGTPAEKHAALRSKATVTIVSLATLRAPRATTDKRGRPRYGYWMPPAKTVIFDESHHLRLTGSAQYKGALDLAKRAERVYLLTATPMQKNADDWFAQLRLLAPDKFTSYWKFVERYCKLRTTNWTTRIVGMLRKDELDQLLEEYVLGRTYKDVGMELPPLIEKVIALDPTPQFAARYKELKNNYRIEQYGDRLLLRHTPSGQFTNVGSLPAQMHALRRMCNREKMIAFLESLQDAPTGGTVVFCWYQDTAEQLGELLHAPVITGSVNPSERVTLAKESDFTIATLGALSEGVDLSHLRNVVFFECDYLPGRMGQALARVQRWRPTGDNTQPVIVTYIVLRKTIDEHVYNAARKRGATIQQIMALALE